MQEAMNVHEAENIHENLCFLLIFAVNLKLLLEKSLLKKHKQGLKK